MEWYIYAMLIGSALMGLCVVYYFIFSKNGLLGNLPIIKEMNNMLESPRNSGIKNSIRQAQGFYSEPRGKTKYYNPDAQEYEVIEKMTNEGVPDGIERNIVSAFKAKYNLTDAKAEEVYEDGCQMYTPEYDGEGISYDKKTGVIRDHEFRYSLNNDDVKTATISMNLKTGYVIIKET